MLLERANRGLDEQRLVVEDVGLDVRRQRRGDLREARFHRLRHGDGVLAGLLGDDQRQRRPAVQKRRAAKFFLIVDRFADIADANDVRTAIRHRDAVERRRVGDLPHRAHGEFLGALIHPAARQFQVLLTQRGGHVGHGHAVGQHLVGIETNLNLAGGAADDLDLADAADAFERLLDQLVRQPGELLERAWTRDDQLQDRRRVRIELLNHRRERGFGQRRDHEVDLVAHLLGGDVAVLLEQERHRHLRAPFDRGRPQLVDPADRVQRAFELLRDFRFDLFRRGAGIRRPTPTPSGCRCWAADPRPARRTHTHRRPSSDRTSIVANTGRRTQSSASLCMVRLLLAHAGGWHRPGGCLSQAHARPRRRACPDCSSRQSRLPEDPIRSAPSRHARRRAGRCEAALGPPSITYTASVLAIFRTASDGTNSAVSVAGSRICAVPNMPGVTRASVFGNVASTVIAREFGSIATLSADTEPSKTTPGYPDTSACTDNPRRTFTASASLTMQFQLDRRDAHDRGDLRRRRHVLAGGDRTRGDVTGKRRPDDAVVNRLLGAGELCARLRHRGAGAGVLRRQPLVIAAGGEPLLEQLSASAGVGLGVLGVGLGTLERCARLVQAEPRIAVIEQQQRLVGFDGVSDVDECLDHLSGDRRGHVGRFVRRERPGGANDHRHVLLDHRDARHRGRGWHLPSPAARPCSLAHRLPRTRRRRSPRKRPPGRSF